MSAPKVFISYNRTDREWAEWIAGVLDVAGYKPFLQAWHILPGMNFGVEMHKAASEADFTVAVLSASFLKSEFTLPEWIAAFLSDPTGRKRKLIPVRVGECDPSGMLKGVVYIDVVGLDEAAAQKVLLEGLKPPGKPTGPIPFPGQARASVTPSAPFPPSLARLHFVPELPPHFLPRPDTLEAVKAQVLGADSARVAITGRGQAVGVQGMGGIGKSVLAAALAREADILHAFTDGVVWLTIGQQLNLIEVQGKLLHAVTGLIPDAATIHECANAIREALEGRKALIILDDVWESAHAELFRGIPGGCRLLVTTRNSEVLTGLEAIEFQVDLLSPEDSLHLLADWSGLQRDALPLEAPEIVRECGRLPLALAAIGAMVRLGPTAWKDALTRLTRADLEKVRQSFPEYPYPHLLRALEVSVEALPPEDRERYLDLAVFPEEIGIPEGPLRLLWKLDDLDTRDTMRRISARSLATLGETATTGVTLTLHDLQRDLIRKQRENDLTSLHERLLDGYAKLCEARCPKTGSGPRTQWVYGPDDGYFFKRLAIHLMGAGRGAELRKLLIDFNWLQAKLEATNVAELIADYDHLPQDQELALVQGAIRLSAHAVGPDNKQLAGQLIGRLAGEPRVGIRELVRTARKWRAAPWLEPRRANLDPPGTGLLRTLTGHSEEVTAVALSPDGRLAVSASWDHTLKVWEQATGRELRTLTGHSLFVNAVALSPDGRLAVSGSSDNTLKVYDLESGRELRTLTGHRHSVNAVALSPDGRLAVSASNDRTLKVWELETGRELRTLTGHRDAVIAVALSSDGRLAVSGSYDRTLKVWELESGRELRTLAGHGNAVSAVALSPDGRLAVSASWDGTLKFWELATGRELRTLTGHSGGVNAVALIPDGPLAVSGSTDHTLKVWELESGRELRTVTGHSDRVNAVALSPDGHLAVSASDDQTLKVWELASGRELRTLTGHGGVTAVALSPDGRLAVSGSYDHTLKVWELSTGRELRTLTGHNADVSAVALSPDGRLAVSASGDRTLKVWELATGRELLTLAGHSLEVTALALSPDGRLAVSGSYDHDLKVWELKTGREVRTRTLLQKILSKMGLTVYNREVTALALSPDGRLAVTASDDRTLKVWQLANGRELRTLTGHSDRVNAVALSPDGRLAVSASDDRTLKVWELESGRELRTLIGHFSGVTGVALSPDGGLAVSGSRDHTLKVWELESGQILATFTADGEVGPYAFARKWRTIISGETSGRVHFLRLVLPDDRVNVEEMEEQRSIEPVKRRAPKPTPPKSGLPPDSIRQAAEIPNSVIYVVGEVLAGWYYSHSKLNTLFGGNGLPGDPPPGNCTLKCQEWLRRANTSKDIDPLELLGRVLIEFMNLNLGEDPRWKSGFDRITDVLSKNGLAFELNGVVLRSSVTSSAPPRPTSDIADPVDQGRGTGARRSERRFRIALSFPGERRAYVEQVSTHLSRRIDMQRILYDKYHEAELARPDLDVYLPNLYRTESELIAIFLCADYASKRWCRLEWRFVRQLISTRDEHRIMFLSFDDIGAVPELGILGGDGYVSIGRRRPDEISRLILQRLGVTTVPPTAAQSEFSKGDGHTQTSPSPGALRVWQEKLAYLEEQEAITADAAQKFALRKQIKEAKEKIRELGG